MYIGQTTDFSRRLQEHINKKQFWSQAVGFTSALRYSKTEIQYLEYILIKELVECGNAALIENYQIPVEPYISEQMKNALMEDYKSIKVLLLFCGFNIFNEKVIDIGNVSKPDSRKLMNRLVNAYQRKPVSYTDYDDSEEETLLTYIIKEEDCYAEAIQTNNGKYMVLPYGYISTKLDPKFVSEQYNISIDDNRKLLTSKDFDNLSDAAKLITGVADEKLWKVSIKHI